MASTIAPTLGTRHTHTCRGPALPNLSPNLPGRSCRIATRVAVARRPLRHLGYVVSEAKSSVQLNTTGEVGSQSHSLSLRTADPLTATGLVHRSLVTEAQNSRRVSSVTIITLHQARMSNRGGATSAVPATIPTPEHSSHSVNVRKGSKSANFCTMPGNGQHTDKI